MTDLLIVADMYGLDELITICEEAIISNMGLDNIGSILTNIERLNNAEKEELKKAEEFEGVV